MLLLTVSAADSSESPSQRCCCSGFCVHSYCESCTFCSISSFAMDIENLLRNDVLCYFWHHNVVDLSWACWAWIRPLLSFLIPNCLPVMYELILNWLWLLPVCVMTHVSRVLFKSWFKGMIFFFSYGACNFVCLEFAKKSWDWVWFISRGSYTILCNALQFLKFSVWNNDMRNNNYFSKAFSMDLWKLGSQNNI